MKYAIIFENAAESRIYAQAFNAQYRAKIKSVSKLPLIFTMDTGDRLFFLTAAQYATWSTKHRHKVLQSTDDYAVVRKEDK